MRHAGAGKACLVCDEFNVAATDDFPTKQVSGPSAGPARTGREPRDRQRIN
jgi:hypothetical protein